MTVASPVEATTGVSPTGRGLIRSGRGPVLVGVLVVVGAFVIALASSGGRVGYLDPDAVSPAGSRAVAEVLRGQGVEVVRAVGIASATQAEPGDTLVIPVPDALTVRQIDELASTGADLVVVGASRDDIVQALVPDLSAVPAGREQVRDPSCDLAAAVRAGDAQTGGTAYPVSPDALDVVACYPVGGDPTVVEARVDGQRIVLLGSSAPLENDQLAKAGNAALALNLLGQNARVVWLVPSLDDLPEGEPASFWELVPGWFKALLLQVGVAVVLLALWRGRRLGPVVPESLPVVVRAAEATEGRGRMYRRVGARDRAAARLRAATRARTSPLVGLPTRFDPAALTTAVAGRTGRPSADVHALLYGGPPSDDAALVRLAEDLDALERQVRHP